MRLPRAVLALVAIAAVAACAPPSSVASRADEQLEQPSVITVENQRTEDATIYVYHAGTATRRLGRVESLSSATFSLTASDGSAGSEYRFLAKMFANGSFDVSDPIVAVKSVRYHWQL